MKKRTKKWWLIVAAVLVVLAAIVGCGGSDDSTEQAADQDAGTVTEEQEAVAEEGAGPSLEYGELLDLTENEVDGKAVVVVKAKIEPQANNKMTIDQNYYNVADLIETQGFDKYDEIQYWAVADMTDGSESKVVAFTLDKDLIERIAAGSFPANTLGDYVTDLWILPSLEQ